MEYLFVGKGVEIKLSKPDDFLKIKETLTRIGIASIKTNTLYQSCHILHKRGKYYIIHFKELFALDGKPHNISEEDLQRRDAIANLLSRWKLCEIIDEIDDNSDNMHNLKIIAFSEKSKWNLESKYTVGKKETK